MSGATRGVLRSASPIAEPSENDFQTRPYSVVSSYGHAPTPITTPTATSSTR